MELYRPRNPEHFARLCAFAQEFMAYCGVRALAPVFYGSLAYACYTGDAEIEIGDIDVLLEESSVLPLRDHFMAQGGVTAELTGYRSLRLFRGGAKLSVHALEAQNLPPFSAVMGRVGGMTYPVTPLEVLTELYRRAALPESDKAESYRLKYEALCRLQSGMGRSR